MTMNQTAKYVDEGYDYWEAVYRFSTKPMRLVPAPVDGRPDFACFVVKKGRRPFSAAWRKLCVMVDAGAMKCTAGLDDPLGPREIVPPGALIHFHLAENPPDQNIGQVVLEGPNGRRLYDPRFVECLSGAKGLTAKQVINLYEAEHHPTDLKWLHKQENLSRLAGEMLEWVQNKHPGRWTGAKDTLRTELQRRKSY